MPLTPERVLKLQFRCAMYFDGIDDYVMTEKSGIPITTEFTGMVWAWIDPTAVLHFSRFFGMDSYYIEFSCGAGGGSQLGYYYSRNGGRWIWTGVSAPLGTWFEATLRFNNGVTDVFLNTSKVFTRTEPGTSLKAYLDKVTLAWTFSLDTSLRYKGYTAHVLIYTRALSDSEIEWNYLYPDNPVRDGLVLWLYADPAYVKDIDNDGVLEWIDLSGYNNHGKIYGATLVQLIKSASRVVQAQRVLPVAR